MQETTVVSQNEQEDKKPRKKPKQSFHQTLNQAPRSPSRADHETVRPERSRAADRARGPSTELTELELRRILPLVEASALTSLSTDSLMRNHSTKILRLGPRRLGMRLRDVLQIGEETP